MAKQLDVESSLWLGLYLATALPGVSLPDSVKEKVFAAKPIVELGEGLLRNYYDATVGNKEWRQSSYLWQFQRGWLEKLSFLYSYLFLPTLDDYMRTPLPSHLHRLHHLLRPLHLTVEWLNQSLARIFIGWKANRQLLSKSADTQSKQSK